MSNKPTSILMAEIKFEGPLKDTPGLYTFPEDSHGIEQGKDYEEIIRMVRDKFVQKFGLYSQIKWTYTPCCPQSNNLQYVQFILKCKKCSNMLIYRKNTNFQIIYRLIKMDRFHPHGIDEKKQRELNHKIRSQKLLTVDKYEKTSEKLNRIRHERSKIQNLQEFIRHLPHGLLNDTKAQLVQEHFGISYAQYQLKVKNIESEYEKNAIQLFDHFNRSGYQCAYLPQDIIQKNQVILSKIKKDIKLVLQLNAHKTKPYQRLNPKHWNLPNVLLIVTPQMKELYLRYGQYVGFDLTYSLIKQTPQSSKEYLVGIFGGTSESQRIAVYGLVITNNQTVQIYKYLFKEFIAIMGKQPLTIITDEQKSIYYALKQLKDEGGFHGYHLFDTFHILKKFRKASGYEGDNFQLFRQLIHAKNRSQYKILFNKMLSQVRNDNQLTIIKSFDYNSAMYCISQIQKTFVGTGISDSPCEKIHDIIKQEIPHQVNYIKGVLIILQVLKIRNAMIKYGFIQHFAVEQRFNMPFLKPYRLMLSRAVFKILVRQISKSGSHRIRNNTMNHFSTFKKEHAYKPNEKIRNKNAGIFFVDTKIGSFTVFKDHQKFPNQYKWKCLCEFQEKTGVFCSHIAAILLFTGENFYKNIHPRWFIKQQELQQKSKNYGSKIKYQGKVRKNRPGKRRRQLQMSTSQNMSESVDEINMEDNDIDNDLISTTSRPSSKANEEDELNMSMMDNESRPIQDLLEMEQQAKDDDSESNEQEKITFELPQKKVIPQKNTKHQKKHLHFNRWDYKERQSYLKFIIGNFELMKYEGRDKKVIKYQMMSNYVKTRSRIQCQAYHKSQLEKYESLQNIIFEFKARREDDDQ